jgi:hypothetical protein
MSRPPFAEAFVGRGNPFQRQLCMRAGTLGELRQPKHSAQPCGPSTNPTLVGSAAHTTHQPSAVLLSPLFLTFALCCAAREPLWIPLMAVADDRMTFWHALTHIVSHRPQTAPSCPVWIAHHPLPLACGPLQVAPVTLHCGYWLNAPQPPAKSPHCTVRR